MRESITTEIFSIIHMRYADTDFNVASLSDALHVDKSTLFRKCKRYFKQSPHEIIESYRMKKAIELLQVEDIRVKEVAYDIGFDSYEYFSKKFKNYYGICPSAVRA
jgi:AraC-like DNA-binding protein